MNVHERMSHFNVPGVSITYFENAKIKWSKCFGTLEKDSAKDVNKHSIFHACSISKMVTAICVLRLAQDSVLDLNLDVNNYLTSWKIPANEFTDKKKVTLLHLLSHQAGFYDCDGSFPPYKDSDPIPSALDILKGITCYNQEEVHVKYVPETDCEYSDAGYCIIEHIFENVLGESVSQVAKRIVFDPLGLKHTFFWGIGKALPTEIDVVDLAAGHDSKGEIVADKRAHYPNIEGAGLWTTTEELAHIVIDVIKAYQGMNSLVLNQDMAKLMLTPFGCTDDMGLGVFLATDKSNNPCFLSQGWGVGMQCKLRAYYENQNGVIVMTNSEPGMEQDKALIGEIIAHVCENKRI